MEFMVSCGLQAKNQQAGTSVCTIQHRWWIKRHIAELLSQFFFKFHSRILSGHSPEYSNAINNDGMVFEHPTISIVQRIRFEVMAKAQSKPEESGGAFKHKAMTWQLVVTCSPSFKHIANQRLAVSPDMNEQMHKGNTSNNWIQLIQIPEAQLVWPLVSKGASAHLKE